MNYSQETRSRYLNYEWWKRRQEQRDEWYTSTEEEYEQRKDELDELKDDNPIDESEYELPPLDYNYLEQKGAHQSLDKNEGYLPQSLDATAKDKFNEDTSDSFKLTMLIVLAVPACGLAMYSVNHRDPAIEQELS